MKRMNIAWVTRVENISPNMIRVRLQSEKIRDFPSDVEGGHLKLVIPLTGQSESEFQRFLDGFGIRKRMRTYTVRHLHKDTGEIDVDFVVHGDEGPASAWALSAKIGSFIGFSFPGHPKLKKSKSDTYLIAVDMTAFPAAAAGVEALPDHAKGDFYAEILSEDDVQPINAPTGINLHWIVKSAANDETKLINAIRCYPLSGDESVFIAGEFETVGALRYYFRQEQTYPKDQLYISSYWKRGLIEAEHKRVKTLVA